MRRCPIRAFKYAIYLVVIVSLMLGIFYLFDNNSVSLDILTSSRGMMMIAVIILFALTHPFIGYVTKPLVFDANQRAEAVDKVMDLCGYVKVSETDEVKSYRGATLFKRLSRVFEDEITITTVDGVSTMTGPRKEVVRAYFRMETFIRENE